MRTFPEKSKSQHASPPPDFAFSFRRFFLALPTRLLESTKKQSLDQTNPIANGSTGSLFKWDGTPSDMKSRRDLPESIGYSKTTSPARSRLADMAKEDARHSTQLLSIPESITHSSAVLLLLATVPATSRFTETFLLSFPSIPTQQSQR